MSNHPVAKAIAATARRVRIEPGQCEQFEELSGRGVTARVDGRDVRIGRRTWLADSGIDLSAMNDAKYAEPEGVSILYVVRDGEVLGWIGMEDRTREEARQAMEELRDLNVRERVMVTGDRWSVARRVAREMGCTEVQAEVLPADKLELVDALKKEGHLVAVVGDGVNDAPALAAGDLSIAMGAAGSDVAINSATVALMNNDLRRLAFLVRLSRQTVHVVHQNLLVGACFIVAFLIMAGLGIISPVVGAVLHTCAASFVVFNSARLVRFGEELHAGDQAETISTARAKLEHVTA
jgi:Cd2+/Zn2+-exporting ATPase